MHAAEEQIEFDGGLRGEHIAARVRVGTPPTSDENCVWEKVSWTDPMRNEYPFVNKVAPPEESGYKAFVKSCTQPEQQNSLHWIHKSVFDTLGNRAENAIDRLIPKPAINFAPSPDRGVVNVGSWFWIDKSAWKKISVTAYVPTKIGMLSVTTSATPKTIIFSPNDGGADRLCSGPGRVWYPSFSDKIKSSCMYTYRHGSQQQPNGRYRAKVAIEWDVSVRTAIGKSRIGFSGRVSSVRTSTTVPLRIREIQAVAR